jgi:hypothetical protein
VHLSTFQRRRNILLRILYDRLASECTVDAWWCRRGTSNWGVFIFFFPSADRKTTIRRVADLYIKGSLRGERKRKELKRLRRQTRQNGEQRRWRWYNNTRSAAAAAGESMCLRHTDRSREPITHLNSRQPAAAATATARVKRDRNPPPRIRACVCS